MKNLIKNILTMKKIYVLLLTLTISSLSFGQSSDLYISMFGEGSSNNKFIEIYNGTNADIDLTGYSISTCSNGCDIEGEFDYPDNVVFEAGTIIAAGDVYVIAHGSADPLIDADQTFTYLSNGDDFMALTLAGASANSFTIVDALGDMSTVDGTGWDIAGVSNATVNHTLTRKPTICDPNSVPLGSFGTNAEDSEWIVGESNSGWSDLQTHTGCVSGPVLSITSPSNNQVLESGTTSVTLSVSVDNFAVDNTPANGGTGDGHIHWTLDGVEQPMKYDTLDEIIDVVDGGSHTVTMTLVDNTHTPITPTVSQTISFSVSFPCDLQVGTIATTCDASTSEVDTFTTEIAFTGGGTSNYTISTTGNVGTIGGDDPSIEAAGTITITGVNEGTSFVVSFLGDTSNSNCDFTRSINSPSCVGAITCADVGDIIITEIMQNPAAVNDSYGEYFEVYNTTSSSIDMQGWEIKDDLTTTEVHVISNLTVAANSYAVIGINSNSSVNGGYTANYQYSSISLGNGADGLIIECSGTVIDQVIWDGGSEFPNPSGKSMELNINAYTNTANDSGANWAESNQTFGDGDFGTPGSQNTFSTGDHLVQNTFNLYPNPAQSNFVNISSTGSGAIQANVFDILGKQVINAAVSNGRLDVSPLHTGVYIVKLTQGDATTTKKLIIQ